MPPAADATVDALRKLAYERQTTLTEVIRDAIATEEYLDEQVANGGKVLIESRPKQIKEVVFRQMGKRRPSSPDAPAASRYRCRMAWAVRWSTPSRSAPMPCSASCRIHPRPSGWVAAVAIQPLRRSSGT